MGDCKNSTASGCRCVEHEPGLLAFSSDPLAYAAALDLVRPPKPALRVVEDPEPVVVPLRPRKIRQPWEARPSRRLAA